MVGNIRRRSVAKGAPLTCRAWDLTLEQYVEDVNIVDAIRWGEELHKLWAGVNDAFTGVRDKPRSDHLGVGYVTFAEAWRRWDGGADWKAKSDVKRGSKRAVFVHSS